MLKKLWCVIMSNTSNNKNDDAWETIFSKYDILHEINKNACFEISSQQMKESGRDPRLMAKFDNSSSLPHIFKENNLSILPISRGKYIISNIDTYHSFESNTSKIYNFALPNYLQSLDATLISSESIALNCAFASNILEDFLGEEELCATVNGRMTSGVFSFKIRNSKIQSTLKVDVNNAQIEIDAGYEGLNSLSIIEAKLDLADDFIARQLFYPFRLWESKIAKRVRPIFLVYSNGIFTLYEYTFFDKYDYNSLQLINMKKYSLEDTDISINDIQQVASSAALLPEPNDIPFPQADKFDRIINLCEQLERKSLTQIDVTNKFLFASRQTNYYADAGRYLGLIYKEIDGSKSIYTLSDLGRKILKLNFKKRQLAYCNCVLQHKIFRDVFNISLQNGSIPSKDTIVSIMKSSGILNVRSEITYSRRAQTVSSWVEWILKLQNAP